MAVPRAWNWSHARGAGPPEHTDLALIPPLHNPGPRPLPPVSRAEACKPYPHAARRAQQRHHGQLNHLTRQALTGQESPRIPAQAKHDGDDARTAAHPPCAREHAFLKTRLRHDRPWVRLPRRPRQWATASVWVGCSNPVHGSTKPTTTATHKKQRSLRVLGRAPESIPPKTLPAVVAKTRLHGPARQRRLA